MNGVSNTDVLTCSGRPLSSLSNQNTDFGRAQIREEASRLASDIAGDLSHANADGAGCSGGAPSDARGGGVQSILDGIASAIKEISRLLTDPSQPSIAREASTLSGLNGRLQAAWANAPVDLAPDHHRQTMDAIAELTALLERLAGNRTQTAGRNCR